MAMPAKFGALTILLLLAMVLTRVFVLRKRGIAAMKFGELDNTDYLIPPFALLYFYLIFATAFRWPGGGDDTIFSLRWLPWIGVVSCAAGLAMLLWSLVSFGTSFRVGIDADRPDNLVTSGIFAFTRNPIYVAFALVLLGEFLIFANWTSVIGLVAGILLFHRQILREESYLLQQYGEVYRSYCSRVPRYL